jgi:SEFIR domain
LGGEQAGGSAPARVLISYAHDDGGHCERVRQLWTFLLSVGVDAMLDVLAQVEQQYWPAWMSEQIRSARFIVVVASPVYRRRAEGREEPGAGHGVVWEARALKDLLYADPEAFGRRWSRWFCLAGPSRVFRTG